MKPWQVLIVEDDQSVLSDLVQQIKADPRLALCAALSTRQSALDWMARQTMAVDVLLCDLGLPDGSGLDVIRTAFNTMPQCETMVISVFGDEVNVLASIEAGAVGYIHKDADWQHVTQLIADMKAGASPMSPMIARGVLTRFRESARATPLPAVAPPTAPHISPLTSKEAAILERVARGFLYAEIAALEQLSVLTVRTHIKNIYRKLAVHSKNEAVFEARQLGIIRDLPKIPPRSVDVCDVYAGGRGAGSNDHADDSACDGECWQHRVNPRGAAPLCVG